MLLPSSLVAGCAAAESEGSGFCAAGAEAPPAQAADEREKHGGSVVQPIKRTGDLAEKNASLAHRDVLIHHGDSLASAKNTLNFPVWKGPDHAQARQSDPLAEGPRQIAHEDRVLLQSVARERAVLVIEHDMEFVRNIARTVTVLHEGQVLCEGPVEQVQKDERVMEVYLGRSREAHA